MLYALIMAGGSGTRFWPESRRGRPKQFLSLLGSRSMLQQTVDRLEELVPPQRIRVFTNERLVDQVREQLPKLAADAIVGEPAKRDTAPCIGLAAAQLCRLDPEATMVVLPSDHSIRPLERFCDTLRQAERLVDERANRLITFGIRPSYPAETFGYVERGSALPTTSVAEDSPAFQVARFHEKPDADVARGYVDAGTFYWNSGIFVWRAKTILDALASFEPAMYEHLARIAEATGSPDYADVFKREFAAIDGTSIDFAVMERAAAEPAHEVIVIEAPFQWDDVGGWRAISRQRGVDKSGNTVAGRHVGLDTEGTIVRTRDDHLVATLGLRDVIVVHTPDATLVANKHDEESIRKLVDQIKDAGLDEFL